MALTRSFNETVRTRAQTDPEFRRELLRETIAALRNGEFDVVKAVLQDHMDVARKLYRAT